MSEIFTSSIIILHASSIALGVGGSTLAIASYLTALHDTTIDPSERRMLGVIYTVLRTAMVLILLTAIIITWLRPDVFGTSAVFLFTLIGVLYANALLMSFHTMPMTIGPALQAATWYTLGFIVSITMFELFVLTPLNFIVLYGADVLVAFSVVTIASRLRK